MKIKKIFFLLPLLTIQILYPQENPEIITYSSPKTLAIISGVKIFNSGFGSAVSVRKKEPGYFYMLTDRGPNFKGKNENEKIFPVPDFVPQIGKFKIENNSLVLIKSILLKDENGKNLTGIPSAKVTNETSLDIKGNVITPKNSGIDSEGLVVMEDGTFWVSDEYGPFIIHFDSEGTMLEKISPDSKTGSIPKVFSLREPNKGMEGLTITPDGKYLVGIMQAPFFNPDENSVKKSKVCRILYYEIKTGRTKQYIYLLDDNDFSLSDITAVSNSSFLVIERDGKDLFGKKTSKAKNIYRIDISNATDVNDSGNILNGKLFFGKTIEELKNYKSLLSNEIIPVKKELFLDLLKFDYSFDKPEGLAILNDSTIAVTNDDDFGIDSKDGKIIQKMVNLKNGGKAIDRTSLYIFKVPSIGLNN